MNINSWKSSLNLLSWYIWFCCDLMIPFELRYVNKYPTTRPSKSSAARAIYQLSFCQIKTKTNHFFFFNVNFKSLDFCVFQALWSVVMILCRISHCHSCLEGFGRWFQGKKSYRYLKIEIEKLHFSPLCSCLKVSCRQTEPAAELLRKLSDSYREEVSQPSADRVL